MARSFLRFIFFFFFFRVGFGFGIRCSQGGDQTSKAFETTKSDKVDQITQPGCYPQSYRGKVSHCEHEHELPRRRTLDLSLSSRVHLQEKILRKMLTIKPHPEKMSWLPRRRHSPHSTYDRSLLSLPRTWTKSVQPATSTTKVSRCLSKHSNKVAHASPRRSA